MPSKIQVDQIAGATGNTVTLPSGQTLDLSSGTVNLPSASLSALNATNLTSGTVPNARLSGITADKLDLISTASVPSITAKGTPSVSDGYIQLNCEQNSHGIKIKSPPHSAGANYTMVMPNSLGTASQVLRMNSGATALEFATPAVASSDYVLLATTTASSSSTISFDGYFSSTYDTYLVRFYDIYHSASAHFSIRYRRSNADVTASSYKMVLNQLYTDLTPSTQNSVYRSSWNSSYLSATQGDYPTNQATSSRIQGELILFNPLNTATYKAIQTTISRGRVNDLQTMQFETAYGRLEDSTSALSGLTFFPDSGNFVAGTFKLYGIK